MQPWAWASVISDHNILRIMYFFSKIHDFLCSKINFTITERKDSNFKYFPTNSIKPYSAGIDFSRQNLTSVDVRFWRLKSIPEL